jgi:DNA-binding NarL/FixJ family response regulator
MILNAEPDIDVVGEAADGAEAISLAADIAPQVVLMDIRMPDLDGIEATRRILQRSRGEIRVLMLTTFDHDEYLYDAIRAGASGFLLKDVHPADLAHAVRTVASGDALVAPTITRRLLEDFVERPRPGARAPDALNDLTGRELDVLKRLARGLSNAEIAADLVLGEATIKTHVGNILMKLGLRDRVQAVVLAYETGLMRPRTTPTDD